MSNFDRSSIRCFRFVRCSLDPETGIARLVYAFDDGPELIETVTFPGAPFTLDTQRAQAAQQALRLLHLLTGVSYYKAAVPPEIRIDDYAIDADTAAMMEEIYVNGLGEFAYRNGLDLHGRVRFPIGKTEPDAPAPALGLRQHALVAIGGGKDSLVSIEALRGAHRFADLQPGARAGAGTVRVQPAGRLERPYPGHRDQFGDHGAGGAAAGRRPGGVLQ